MASRDYNYLRQNQRQVTPPTPIRPTHGGGWKRIAGWILGGIALLILFAIVGLYIWVHTSSFKSYVLNLVTTKATTALNTPVRVQNLDLQLHNLSVDLYGITIEGAGPGAGKPLLQADHVNVNVNISSIFGLKWYVEGLRIDHPVATLIVDQNGNTNLPALQKSNSSSSTNVFDLGIRHFLLDRGEIYVNDRKIPVYANLNDLHFRSTYNKSNGGTYQGTFGYSGGQIKYASYSPMTHDLEAGFDLTPSQFKLQNATLTTPPMVAKLNADVQNYSTSTPTANANYTINIDGAKLRSFLNQPTVPVGQVTIAGTAEYKGEPNTPALQSLAINGQVSSSDLRVNLKQLNTTIHNLGAKYQVANGNAQVTDLHANLLGGEVSGHATVTDLPGKSEGKALLDLTGVSLGGLKTAVNTSSLNQVSIRGNVNGTVSATWTGAMKDLIARADLKIASTASPARPTSGGGSAASSPLLVPAPNTRPGKFIRTAVEQSATSFGGARLVSAAYYPQQPDPAQHKTGTHASANAKKSSKANQPANPNSVPINGEIHLIYNGKTNTITLHNSHISTPETNLNLNGTVSKNSALKVNLHANSLHELEDLANTFRPSKPGEGPPQPLDLHGKLSFQGTISGSANALDIKGHLTGAPVEVHGASFKLLQADVDASPSHIDLSNGLLEPAAQGRMNFSLQAALHHWSLEPQSALQANLDANKVAVGPIMKAANISTPVSGTLNGNVALHGSKESPVGHGDLALTNADVAGQPVQAIKLNFQGTGDSINSNLAVQTAAGNADAKFTYYPKQEGYQGALQATGIELAKLEAVKSRDLGITGKLNLNANGQGTFANPQARASLSIPQLTVKGQKIDNVNLQATVANHEATFNLVSQIINAALRAQGKVALTDGYQAEATLDTPVIALQPLLAAYAPAEAEDLSGQTQIHATLSGPLKDPKLLQAHVNIPTLQVKYGQVKVAAANPILADYADGVLSLQPSEIQGTDTDLRFQGKIPIASTAPASLTLLGNVNLALMHVVDPDVDSSGEVQLDINAAQVQANPNVEGQIRIVNASFSTAGMPIGLSEGNGVLTLRRDRIDVSQFTGKVGGGTVTASGGVVYRPSIQFDLALKGSSIRLLYPQGLRSDLGLRIAMTGTPKSALLSGQVSVEGINFTPDFDLTSFASQFGGVSAPPPPNQGFSDRLKLNIALRSTNGLNAYSRTVSIQGDANLHVIGTLSDPVIVGRTNLTGGEVFALGNRYVIQGGTIAFVNTVTTEPVLNLQVNTTINQYNIAMRFQGPLDQLHTNYTSDPALPPADIIHLIAFGQTQEAAAAQAQPGTLGAESVVASAVSSQVTGRLEKAAGISHLSIDPVLGTTGQQNPGARITVQQRVTSKLYVTFSTDITQTQSQEVLVQYRVNRKWSVSGDRDQSGGFGLDGRYHKDF